MSLSLRLDKIAATQDGSGHVIISVSVVDDAGNVIQGAASGDATLDATALATALALSTLNAKAAEIKRIILVARPDWATATVTTANVNNLAAAAAVTDLSTLINGVGGLPYKFTLT